MTKENLVKKFKMGQQILTWFPKQHLDCGSHKYCSANISNPPPLPGMAPDWNQAQPYNYL